MFIAAFRVAEPPAQLRHLLKIHAVNTGNESQGNEDGGDDGRVNT